MAARIKISCWCVSILSAVMWSRRWSQRGNFLDNMSNAAISCRIISSDDMFVSVELCRRAPFVLTFTWTFKSTFFFRFTRIFKSGETGSVKSINKQILACLLFLKQIHSLCNQMCCCFGLKKKPLKKRHHGVLNNNTSSGGRVCPIGGCQVVLGSSSPSVSEGFLFFFWVGGAA